ncbi:pilus assembly protein PilO [Curtobacterium sp. PhB130]|uniref:type 4a pilus biogenesis protein PilO n=1 Tax=unclassified Curtobacterium TaxID=257496 RepID=UPI000F4B0EE2|nr:MULTISPECIES: type 4a pilus biogenesis protein PilO [unclassified Curtobacterium]ROS77552.1 pilus assembly protein PilO [Curtobacterium sp. PhB130]TCK66241.1 pilus assembly protein PilO [Curtobacterium sp. PhB136]
MSRNRLSLLLAFVAMAVVAVGGFFLAVQPQLAQASTAHDQRATVEQSNASSQHELDRLRKQAEQLPAMQKRLAQLSASVPDSAGISAFIDQIDAVATASGMQVSSYTTSDATAYAPAASAAETSGTSAGDTATSSATATATPTAPAAPTSPTVTTNAAITGTDFSVVPVTVAVDGTFDQALSFVKGMQTGSRLFLITTISSAEKSGDDGSTSAQSTWTFGGSIYVLDRSAGTAASTPAATPTNG